LTRLVFTVEFGTHRTTALTELGRRFIQDPQAAAAPDTGPVRGQEGIVEAPCRVAVVDLDPRWVHGR
jgi:hypothetical protein